MSNRVIAILGTTASGKGALALALAQRLGGEIVSVDSMKIYRGLDLGTAKPTVQARTLVPYHLIDVVEPAQPFSAASYVELAEAAIEDIHRRGRVALLSGGTLLYFQCLYRGMFAGPGADSRFRESIRARMKTVALDELHAELVRVDPAAGQRIHPRDARRIERALEVFHLTGQPISLLQQQWLPQSVRRHDWQWTLIGLRRPRQEESRRVNERVRSMIAAGLVEEARNLHAAGRLGPQAASAVGYAELLAHFRGECTLEQAIERIKIHSRQLAKHQRTWLRRMPEINWIEVDDDADFDPLSRALAMIDSSASSAAPSPHEAAPGTPGT